MSISFVCTACKTKLRAKEHVAGKRIKCLKCGAPVLVPKLSQSVADDVARQVDQLMAKIGIYYRDGDAAADELVKLCATYGPAAIKPLLRILKAGDTGPGPRIFLDSHAWRRIGKMLERMGNLPTDVESQVVIGCAKQDRKGLVALGDAALPFLVAYLQSGPRANEAHVALKERGHLPTDPTAKIAYTFYSGPYSALIELGPPAVVAWLAARLRNRAWCDFERHRAIKALGAMGTGDAVAPLMECLTDPDPERRRRLTEPLGNIKDPRSVDALISLLRDKDSAMRAEAAGSLARIGDPRAVDPLVALLKDSAWSVSEAAAWALGEIRSPAALGPLADLLGVKGEWSGLQERAAPAIEKILQAAPDQIPETMLRRLMTLEDGNIVKCLTDDDHTEIAETISLNGVRNRARQEWTRRGL